MVIPSLNTKGSFKFAPPFDKVTSENQEYTVNSIRNLLDLDRSGEKPFETIYKPLGLTDIDFKNDVDNNIPICVFTTEGCEFFYVPVNRILSLPITAGVKYRETVLALSLGNIPVDMNLELVKQSILEIVLATTGIETSVNEIPASTTVLIDYEQDKVFKSILNSKKTMNSSYLTKYNELQVQNEKLIQLVKNLENVIKTKTNLCNTQ